MPIKWSTVKVSEAADMVEEFVNQAAGPLEQVRIVAREALNIPNLPQYVDQHFRRLIGEIDRAIGGSLYEPVGRLKACLLSIRKALPAQAVEAEKTRAKYGQQQCLLPSNGAHPN